MSRDFLSGCLPGLLVEGSHVGVGDVARVRLTAHPHPCQQWGCECAFSLQAKHIINTLVHIMILSLDCETPVA